MSSTNYVRCLLDDSFQLSSSPSFLKIGISTVYLNPDGKLTSSIELLKLRKQIRETGI